MSISPCAVGPCWWGEQQPPTKDNINAVRALFEQALKIDLNDTDALAGDAEIYMIEYLRGDGQRLGPITRQKYLGKPTGLSRSPPITCGRIIRKAYT